MSETQQQKEREDDVSFKGKGTWPNSRRILVWTYQEEYRWMLGSPLGLTEHVYKEEFKVHIQETTTDHCAFN